MSRDDLDERLSEDLSDESAEVRRSAVQALAELRDPSVAKLLVRALGDDDWRVRKEAVRSATLNSDRVAIVKVLGEALAERDAIGLRNASVETLIALGRDAVGEVARIAPSLDSDGRKLAAEVFAKIPDPRSCEALIGLLSDSDKNVALTAAEGLSIARDAGHSESQAAHAALVRLLSANPGSQSHAALSNPDPLLCIAALQSLKKLGLPLEWDALAPLTSQPLIRREVLGVAHLCHHPGAALALAHAIGESNAPNVHHATIAHDALVALAPRLRDAANAGDGASLSAIRQGLSSSSARARLFALASEEDARVRSAAILALGLVGGERELARVVSALGDESVVGAACDAFRLSSDLRPLHAAIFSDLPNEARLTAIELLSELAPIADSETREAFRTILDSEPAPSLARGALAGLAERGDASDFARVAARMSQRDPPMARTASSALTELATRNPAAAQAFVSECDPAGEMAAAGAAMLHAIGALRPFDDAAILFLERAATHPDAIVRSASFDAIVMVPDSEKAASLVAFGLVDEEVSVRVSALRALGRLGASEKLKDFLMTNVDPSAAVSALASLASCAPRDAFECARSLAKEGDAPLACAAVESSTRFSPDEREQVLVAALARKESDVVSAALEEVFISKSFGASLAAAVASCLTNSDRDVRRKAAEVFAEARGASVHSLLRSRFEAEEDTGVREVLSLAMSVRPPTDGS